jgi:hypothetical protein
MLKTDEYNRRKEEVMRRWSWVPVVLLVILVGIVVGVGAYNAGYDHGLAASGHVTQIVRERPGGFGFVLFPLLFFFLFIMLMRAAFWGRRWGGHGRWGPNGPDHGGWKQGRGAMFDEWHRRQHDQASGDHPGAGGEPAAV